MPVGIIFIGEFLDFVDGNLLNKFSFIVRDDVLRIIDKYRFKFYNKLY